MQLKHIVGNTYYINYPSAVGVYIFDNNKCLLIDTGASSSFGKRTMKILDRRGIKVQGIINTHFHADHSGGNLITQQETGCSIYASLADKIIIENPLLSPFSVYSAYPLKPLQNKLIMGEASKVTHTLTEDLLVINNQEFRIHNLNGHTMGQIGIVTPDEVFFTGDAIISQRNIEKFPFLYMADLTSYLETINKLKATNYPYVVVSHGGLLENWQEALEANKKLIEAIIEIILAKLTVPQSRETIVQEVINKLNLPINTSQFFLVTATVSAYLSYLHSNRQIKIIIEDQQVKFF
ncbi:MAG TPA: MBL fold metallo-hydrolase [Syntrophomonadaceae bacterium]|nr:MBL fold metallo-hydrolase [Syntrophomonadaceae bacterium]